MGMELPLGRPPLKVIGYDGPHYCGEGFPIALRPCSQLGTQGRIVGLPHASGGIGDELVHHGLGDIRRQLRVSLPRGGRVGDPGCKELIDLVIGKFGSFFVEHGGGHGADRIPHGGEPRADARLLRYRFRPGARIGDSCRAEKSQILLAADYSRGDRIDSRLVRAVEDIVQHADELGICHGRRVYGMGGYRKVAKGHPIDEPSEIG